MKSKTALIGLVSLLLVLAYGLSAPAPSPKESAPQPPAAAAQTDGSAPEVSLVDRAKILLARLADFQHESLLHSPLKIGIVCGLLLILGMGVVADELKKAKGISKLGFIFLGLFAAVLMIAGFYGFLYLLTWPLSLGKFLDEVAGPIQASRWLQLLAALAVLGLAFGLVQLKKHAQAFYGFLEVIGGFATAWVGFAEHSKTGPAFALLIVGAAFLMIRGIENIEKGLKA
jgi:hypothetical protein